MAEQELKAAIVDYGLGNLFSVQQACRYVGLEAAITADSGQINSADLIILPGVGAFGDAMTALNDLGLADLLKGLAGDGRLLVGICLGQQLLLTESEEFGAHRGLDLIPGRVLRFKDPIEIVDGPDGPQERRLKVPQVGWNRIEPPEASQSGWGDGPLENVPVGAYMYFVHSYYTAPDDPDVVLSTTRYGNIEFCSSLRYKNVFAFQFHPERSGAQGLEVYRSLAKLASGRKEE